MTQEINYYVLLKVQGLVKMILSINISFTDCDFQNFMNFEHVFVWMDNSYVDIYLSIWTLCKYMYCRLIFFKLFWRNIGFKTHWSIILTSKHYIFPTNRKYINIWYLEACWSNKKLENNWYSIFIYVYHQLVRFLCIFCQKANMHASCSRGYK